jgi:hypothetical protein
MRFARYSDETAYERTQRHNALTRWLHSIRYRRMVELVGRLSVEMPDRPVRIVEIGCAVSKLYEALDQRFDIEYVGIEIDPEFCRIARERHGHRPNFRILNRSATEESIYAELGTPDILAALETLEHIPEHDVVRIVEHIGRLAPRYFVASVPVEVGPAIWIKNVGSFLVGYARAKGRPWSQVFWAGLYQLDRLPPHGTGHAGFDWRWLAHTIRHNMRIKQVLKSPLSFLPPAVAFSVMFVAVPRTPAPAAAATATTAPLSSYGAQSTSGR